MLRWFPFLSNFPKSTTKPTSRNPRRRWLNRRRNFSGTVTTSSTVGTTSLNSIDWSKLW
ncbi:hypothetical protein MtrunA17_Chr2g0332781 [Medicago truncatula]|uniref:Uncharacterized protein n=1 Tax=Medicago truncatula TaxID=3880 RepID=A0A396JJL3_MEDTR|nr:hypothetical protein MtrunA17_Chr2g0332781 [Medicago truncatula]